MKDVYKQLGLLNDKNSSESNEVLNEFKDLIYELSGRFNGQLNEIQWQISCNIVHLVAALMQFGEFSNI